ncbi:MAG: LiaF domain-containing protein [Bacteroidales bacterium]
MHKTFFSSAFWGITIIFVGVAMLLRNFFDFDIPVFTIIAAGFLIFLGVRMIVGHTSGHNSSNSAVFSDQKMGFVPGQNKYNVLFGNSNLDLSRIDLTENKLIEVSCVFGEFRIAVARDTNLQIFSSAAFGNFTSPMQQSNAFGSLDFRSPNFDTTKPALTIRAEVVFGNVKVFYI